MEVTAVPSFKTKLKLVNNNQLVLIRLWSESKILN